MPVVVFVTLLILVLALVIVAVVVMGIEGQGRDEHPELAHMLAKTASHLNGEAEAPHGLQVFFDEAESSAGELKERIKSARSALSARSAASASELFSAFSGSASSPEPEPEPVLEPDPEASVAPEQPAADGWAVWAEEWNAAVETWAEQQNAFEAEAAATESSDDGQPAVHESDLETVAEPVDESAWGAIDWYAEERAVNS